MGQVAAESGGAREGRGAVKERGDQCMIQKIFLHLLPSSYIELKYSSHTTVVR